VRKGVVTVPAISNGRIYVKPSCPVKAEEEDQTDLQTLQLIQEVTSSDVQSIIHEQDQKGEGNNLTTAIKQQLKTCPSCRGSGILDDIFICNSCKGRGYIEA